MTCVAVRHEHGEPTEAPEEPVLERQDTHGPQAPESTARQGERAGGPEVPTGAAVGEAGGKGMGDLAKAFAWIFGALAVLPVMVSGVFLLFLLFAKSVAMVALLLVGVGKGGLILLKSGFGRFRKTP